MQDISQFKSVLFVGITLLGIIFVFEHSPANIFTPVKNSALHIFDDYTFSAKSVFILDDTTGEVLYGENSDEAFEFASITKLMTALVALEYSPDQIITIDEESYATEGNTGLLVGERWQKIDLVVYMLTNSSNDAAEALARSYPRGREKFIERMNDTAREFGFGTLQFQNPTGLNETEDWGGKGSAQDVARLLSVLYKKHPEIFVGTTQKEFVVASLDTEHVAENTNLVANALFGIQASKTGYTDQAGGSLAVRFNIGLDTPVIAVILGTDTREERFEDMFEVVKGVAKQEMHK